MNKLKIIKATVDQKELIRRLLELYQYDLSTATGNELNQFGLYDYPYLDNYWTEAKRYPYLLQIDGTTVGFCLVNTYCVLPENNGAYSIGEFFVLKKYRRLGVGREVAVRIIKDFPGKWEIRVLEKNEEGKAFWRKVISDLTAGKFAEQSSDSETWKGLILSFSI